MQMKNAEPSVIIAGGHFASLGMARNLGQHGVSVYVIDSELCITSFSRYIQRFYRCPPESDDDGLIKYIIQLSSNPNVAGSVLFASTDEQVRIFSQNRDKLSEQYIVSTPEWKVTRYLYDKRLTRDLAFQQQIPMPKTVALDCVDDISRLELDYPLVLKPAITSHLVSRTKKKAYRADNPNELISLYNQIREILHPQEIIIQEFIPGGANNLYSYFGYFKAGRPLVGYAARRLRQHPREFGKATTYAVSVCIPELETLATRLLTGLGYTGMAEVEFMYNPIHSRFEFLEVNPRIWGWHTLAINAGVDLPYIAYADLTGAPFTANHFVEGAKWTHFVTDLPTAFMECLEGQLTIGEYFRSIHGSRDAVFCHEDLMPFFAELFLIPYLASRRGF
jgi:predicted ATP-grasp superfamily ATP-dependent carboligase